MSMMPTLAELVFFGGAALVVAGAIYGLVRLASARRPRDS
jgi:hypothetical protein